MIRNGTFRLEGKREKTPDIIYLYGTEKAIGTLNLRLWVGDDTIRVSANSEVPETWIVENNMPQQAEEDFYRQLKGKDNIIKTSRMNSRQLWDRSLTPDSVRILTNQIIQNDLPGQIRRIGYAREISRLQGEIDKYRAEYEENTERLNELSTNPEAIEQIAREKYLMKKPNEDIYVFDEEE